MADKGTITNQQEKILKALILFPEGASIEEIQKAADLGIDKRQFQRRLNTLIESGQTLETDTNAAGENNGTYGTGSNTNSLLGVFQFNTPMVVTSKTTGIEIYTNFSKALSVDFEPIQEGGLQKTNAEEGGEETIYNKNTANGPRLKAIQTGPFGIQFKPVEGGSTE